MKHVHLLGALFVVACRGIEIGPLWHFERMVVQPRANAYGASGVFPDDRVMQPPPPQTIARDEAPGFSPTSASIPFRIDRALLETGQDRYNVVCAPCHGLLGNAATPVAARMIQRPPRSLHEDDIRAAQPGDIFQVIRSGYGFMPSYAAMLTVEESWAVVAYVRALQLSHYAHLDSLPAAVRAQALQHLGGPPVRSRP